jgi:hypothetical protein
MTTHVFIVDSTTFTLHLEYLFAGTGAKDHRIDFNNNPRTALHPTTENMLVSMIADGARIRRGDDIIFYLQQEIPRGIFDGKFYGIFRAREDHSFLDNNDTHQYLKTELGKSLTFRTLIEPFRVYPEGVTEWEALDEIKHLTAPNQMLWSLIYRKLKGNRGNTMITIYEAERLAQLIRNKNARNELNCGDRRLSFDLDTQRIVGLNRRPSQYAGRREDINVVPRLIAKYRANRSFETHLQAYIVRHLGMNINPSLDKGILHGGQIEWLGNEVSCGVGMQRIDVMPSLIRNGQRVLVPIELKAGRPDEKNMKQIQRYVDWIEQYYIPNRQSDIEPVLIARAVGDRAAPGYRRLLESFRRFNEANRATCGTLKYIEFDVAGNELVFDVVAYE